MPSYHREHHALLGVDLGRDRDGHPGAIAELRQVEPVGLDQRHVPAGEAEDVNHSVAQDCKQQFRTTRSAWVYSRAHHTVPVWGGDVAQTAVKWSKNDVEVAIIPTVEPGSRRQLSPRDTDALKTGVGHSIGWHQSV